MTVRIKMRTCACKSVVYVGCGFYSGETRGTRWMNVRGWVVSGTVRLVPTEVSPLDRYF